MGSCVVCRLSRQVREKAHQDKIKNNKNKKIKIIGGLIFLEGTREALLSHHGSPKSLAQLNIYTCLPRNQAPPLTKNKTIESMMFYNRRCCPINSSFLVFILDFRFFLKHILNQIFQKMPSPTFKCKFEILNKII